MRQMHTSMHTHTHMHGRHFTISQSRPWRAGDKNAAVVTLV